MCGSCDSIQHSFFVRRIVSPIAILFNIGLTVYFIISNTLNYDKYERRASYVLYQVPNTTSDYYIVRATVNGTENCSSNTLFTFDVTAVYRNIVSKKGEQNLLFVATYWLSTIVAVLISVFDIVLAFADQCVHRYSDYESWESTSSNGLKVVNSIGSQFLQKGSFLLPTYLIGIFDYTQLCLPHHAKASSFILHHTYIGMAVSLCSMIYLVVWTFACWDSRRHQYGSGVSWVKCIEFVTCENEKASWLLLILLCSAVIPAGVYGIFVWVTSLLEFVLTSKAVLICFNFMFGVIHDVAKICKHYLPLLHTEYRHSPCSDDLLDDSEILFEHILTNSDNDKDLTVSIHDLAQMIVSHLH